MRSGTKEYGMKMGQHLILSAMREDDNYEFDHRRSLEEQILRLQCLVAYLLEKERTAPASHCESRRERMATLELLLILWLDRPAIRFFRRSVSLAVMPNQRGCLVVFSSCIVRLISASGSVKNKTLIGKEQDADRTNA
jgi:hypothetical protein